MAFMLILQGIYLLAFLVNDGIALYSDTTYRTPYDTPYKQPLASYLLQQNTKPYASIKTRVTNTKQDGGYNFIPLNHNIPPEYRESSWQYAGTGACPEGYMIQQYGGSVQCSPVMYPVPTRDTMLACLVNPRSNCGRSRRTKYCPTGTQRVVSMGKVHCIDQRPGRLDSSDVDNLHRRHEIPDNRPSIQTEESLDETPVCKHGQVPAMSDHGYVCVDPVFPASVCPDDRVPAMSDHGYICVDPVFPASVCPDDRVPALSTDGIQCIPCPVGTTIIRTPDGVKCELAESRMQQEPPCPVGLRPLNTATGRICQYVKPEANDQQSKHPVPNHPNPCNLHESLIVSQAGSVCHEPIPKEDFVDLGDKACPYGSVLVQARQRFSCLKGSIPEYIFPMCGPNFVLAKLHHEYKCISQVDTRVKCSGNDILSQVDTGFQCVQSQYQQEGIAPTVCGRYSQYDTYTRRCVPVHHVLNNGGHVRCPRGQTYSKLTDTCLSGYQCFPGQIFSKITGACVSDSLCPPGQTFSKHMSRCISAKQCKSGEMFDHRTGRCVTLGEDHVKTEIQCGYGQVIHTDKAGRRQCISLTDATELEKTLLGTGDFRFGRGLCGAGYRAVEADDGFVCKMERQTITCPPRYTLTSRNGRTVCVKGKCTETSVQHHATDTQTGCHHRYPECSDHYTLQDDGDQPFCVLNVIQPSKGQHTEPCNGNASVRACDVQADVLLQQCNPGCANAGTCFNRTCVCPPGITGHACHLDIDECLTHACDYQCENTFGSFHCVCPVGMMLEPDGVACKDIGCVQPCLNNGTCRRGECVCSSGFDGEHCEIDKDECAVYDRRLCEYQCRNTYGGYQCICPPGSTLNTDGRTCNSTTCTPECRNGGTCRNHKCQCPKTFYGIVCQFDVNECREGRPCEHICTNSWGSYHCSCRPGFILQPDNRSCREHMGSQ